MTSRDFMLLGYVVAIALLWGYAAHLWWMARSLATRETSRRGGGGDP